MNEAKFPNTSRELQFNILNPYDKDLSPVKNSNSNSI